MCWNNAVIKILFCMLMINVINADELNQTVDANIRKVLNLTTTIPVEFHTTSTQKIPTSDIPTSDIPADNNFLHHNTPHIYRSRFIDQIKVNPNLKIQNETHAIIANNITVNAFLQPKMKNFSIAYNERKKEREYNHVLSKASHITLPTKDESKFFDDDGLDDNTITKHRVYYNIDTSNKTYSRPNIVPFSVLNYTRDSTYNDKITAIFRTLRHFYKNDTQEKEINTTSEIQEYIFKKLKPKTSELVNITIKSKKADPTVAEIYSSKEQVEYLERQLKDFPYMVAYYEDILKELERNKPEPKVAPLVKDYTPPRVALNHTDFLHTSSNSGVMNNCGFIWFIVIAFTLKM